MMEKRDAIRLAQAKITEIHKSNTSFGNINTRKPVWWVCINFIYLSTERYLILAAGRELIVCRIPANSLAKQDFKIKAPNQIDFELSTNAEFFLIDVKSGGSRQDFNRFVIDRIPIER